MKRFKGIILSALAVFIVVAYALPSTPASAVSSAALSIVPKKNYTIEELSIVAGMNRTKLQAGFKDLFGKTIYSYTLDLKMTEAKALLTGASRLSLKEIAALLGYSHTNHFSAAFKKKFNVSPSFLKKGLHWQIIFLVQSLYF